MSNPVKSTFVTLSIALLCVVLMVFPACYKNVGITSSGNSNPNHIPPDQTVIASLQGRVVDQNGVPVQGATVSSGGITTSSDINGLFSFSHINMSSRFGFVTVVKQGFYTGSRSVITNPGASNYVSIQLVPKAVSGTFPAPTGGKVAVGTGDTASFAPSSVVEASSGVAYTGMVTVYATYLNPTDPNLYKYMPGDLRGIGSDGNETALQSFGMMDVEMVDDAGNKLQLASGQPAILTFAIPDTLAPVAPATIPLWYFNDSSGRWIQQGSAVKQGNTYVGQVGHFTYWNCDAPMGTVNFKVHVVDQYGNPLAYRYIQFNANGYGTRGGYTDSTGFAQGLIPKGVEMQLQVLSDCGGFIGGVNVGPALSDQDLGTVTVNIVHAELTLTGSVVDCSNNPVDSGYVSTLVDGLNYRALVVNGNFSLPINRCYQANASVQVIGADLSSGAVSAVKTITADTGLVTVGTLTACSGPVSQYINFTFNGATYNYATPSDVVSETGGGGYETFSSGDGTNGISLFIQNLQGTGTFSGGIDSAWLTSFNTVTYLGAVTYTITAFGPIGSYIQGSFTGSANHGNPGEALLPISGSFYIQRSN